ncbi:metal-dependent hydrolase [Novosphingobium sp. PC22D]|uniref:M48 family metallopeptidase n=1 Tax=Novosphingobium sp. PC22D TaxID=1962403 RepID=UPI000BF0ADAD|nr:M48 family metallopeptidase [Novosphingobium sp. PC22D]PEQ11320.1 metal-dependent hydrolase [Novosphingobium sp. PC22D]
MIDVLPLWLRRESAAPAITIGERELPIVIRRLARSRRMTMRLAPDGSEVRISMPTWGRTADALAFAASRRDWLARQVAAIPGPVALGHGGTIAFRGAVLEIAHDPAARRRPAIEGPTLRIGGPEASLPSRLRRWMQDEARALLADDLAEYCVKAGRSAPKLALSNAQRRWGSCAPDGAIRINWRLIMAPDAVRRSVVAHEVAHLIHFDHSRAFHACLAGLFEGDIDHANAWLKRHGRSLYVPLG